MMQDAMSPFSEELRSMFRIKYGVMDAEDAMARELIELNKIVMKLENRIERLENDRLRSFHREPPRAYSPPKAPALYNPVDDDAWLATGKDSGNG